jgi:hypothetical protein
MWPKADFWNHASTCSTPATSVSKAVCCPPMLWAPSVVGGPIPLSSMVTTQPSPAASRKEPSAQAWHSLAFLLGVDQGVFRLGYDLLSSTFRPSFTRRFRSEASANHRGIQCLLESFVAGGGSSNFFGVSAGALKAAAISRSRLRSEVGPVGGMSAARIASSPLAVLNFPATALLIAVLSLWNPSRSQDWPFQMASMP